MKTFNVLIAVMLIACLSTMALAQSADASNWDRLDKSKAKKVASLSKSGGPSPNVSFHTDFIKRLYTNDRVVCGLSLCG